jgi:DNA replication and repair protein RecF
MSLIRLGIHNLRVFKQADIELSGSLNLFTGDNAAGKTTILEAVHLLAAARSFRSTQLSDLLRQGEQLFRVTGSLLTAQGQYLPLGIERSREGLTMKAAGQKLKKVSELAIWLPAQVIHPDSHLLISGGPKQRRRFLDWGLFHVEQSFFPEWQRYDKALRQRNAALKAGQFRQTEQAWDLMLEQAAAVIHALRVQYLQELMAVLPAFTQALSGNSVFDIEYQPGWDTDKPLSQVLAETIQRDRQRGFTCAGPHRAELVFSLDGRRAQHYVSRGQEKMLVIALILAQAELFSRRTGKSCVILVDDLAAELDATHQQTLLDILRPMRVQLFITMVNTAGLGFDQWPERKMFHVEHGEIREVL